MRKYFGVIAALLLLVTPAYAQETQRIPLAVAWDMDGEAADADQVVTAAAIVDSKADYTIAAQPDTCRVLNLTLADTDMTAGTFTVTGLDCWGDALVCTSSPYTAGDDSGVASLSVSSGSSSTCAFSSVTSLSNGVMTGESDETVALGYAAINSALSYPIYGVRTLFDGIRFVDVSKFYKGTDDVYASGTTLTEVTTADGGPFQNVSVGDLVYLSVEGNVYERLITAVTSDDEATISSALPSTVATDDKISLRFKKRFVLVESTDAWVPVAGKEGGQFVFDVDLNANTGGVVSSIECAVYGNGEFNPVVVVDTDTVNSAATGTNTSPVNIALTPYTHCRAGAKFGTGDDGDTAAEDINIYLLINRRN